MFKVSIVIKLSQTILRYPYLPHPLLPPIKEKANRNSSIRSLFLVDQVHNFAGTHGTCLLFEGFCLLVLSHSAGASQVKWLQDSACLGRSLCKDRSQNCLLTASLLAENLLCSEGGNNASREVRWEGEHRRETEKLQDGTQFSP